MDVVELWNVEKEQLIQLSWSTSHVGSQVCVLLSWCYNLIRVAWASLDCFLQCGIIKKLMNNKL